MKNIMFNDEYGLTQAVLDGRKTMTRRIVRGEIPLGNLEETEKYAPYQVGEIVAIAQAYKYIYKKGGFDMHDPFTFLQESAGWTNKMFVKAELMPHHIKITGFSIERMQEITNEDCLKEGIQVLKGGFRNQDAYTFKGENLWFKTPRKALAALIDKVSGKGTWKRNPLVWVYEFELVD